MTCNCRTFWRHSLTFILLPRRSGARPSGYRHLEVAAASFDLLQRNIRENGLGEVIRATHAAVRPADAEGDGGGVLYDCSDTVMPACGGLAMGGTRHAARPRTTLAFGRRASPGRNSGVSRARTPSGQVLAGSGAQISKCAAAGVGWCRLAALPGVVLAVAVMRSTWIGARSE